MTTPRRRWFVPADLYEVRAAVATATEKKPRRPVPSPRSGRIKHGVERAPHRSLLRATGVTVHLVLSHATSAYMRGFYSPAKASVAANSALVQGLLLAILMRVHSLIAGGLQSDG